MVSDGKRARAFISMPMRFKTDEQVRAEMSELRSRVEGMGYEVADSIVGDAEGARNKPLFYLAKSLEVLSGCDVAFFADGWSHARGCRIEYDAAWGYGVEVVLLGDLINHEQTQEVVCPYCGYEHVDSYEYDNEGTAECENCGREFRYERDYWYSTCKMGDDDD